MQRNGQKTRLKKIEGKRRQRKKILNFFGQKAFDMDLPQKKIGVFELPL
jgi:hypothetical protein